MGLLNETGPPVLIIADMSVLSRYHVWNEIKLFESL